MAVTRAVPAKRLAKAVLNTGSQTTTSTVNVDLSPSLTFTFVAGTKPVVLRCFMAILTHSAASAGVNASLTDSANTAVANGRVQLPVAGLAGSIYMESDELVLTPGTSYTYKVRWAASIAGTATLSHNSAANIAVLTATEVNA